MKKGDWVRVRRNPSDEWCEAEVWVISENGRSVGLRLHGAVRCGDGFILGALPLIVDPEAQTAEGLTGDRYEVVEVTE